MIEHSGLNSKKNSIDEVLTELSCIQVDPINTVAPSHELSLYNRVMGIKRSDLNSELYEKKTLFEYWFQLYSIIPMKFFPYFAERSSANLYWHDSHYKAHRTEIDATLDFVKKNGSTGIKDLMHLPKVSGVFNWGDSQSRAGLLTYLWDKGVLMVSHRSSNQKYYDLTENIVPKEILNQKKSHEEILEFYLTSYFKYLGIVRRPQLTRMGHMSRTGVKDLFKKWEKERKILGITIDGQATKLYILKEHAYKIDSSPTHTKLNILPPLDPLIIDRDILNDVFDYFYRWEAYTPALKRKFDQYGMPILYKGEINGQIALRKDLVNRKLKIHNLEKFVFTNAELD